MVPPSVIVVGAAANSYLRIRPSADLTILAAEESYGGVWSRNRIYPGLVVDSPRSMIEYPERSMVDDTHPAYGLVPGAEVHEYLTKFATDAELVARTRFNTIVRSIRRNNPSGWLVETGTETLECDKLILATGIQYDPNFLDKPTDSFKGPVFHSKTMQRDHVLMTSPEVKDVVVVGGAKSAFEAAELALKAGENVHWIVRKSGNGPAMIVARELGSKGATGKDRALFNFARSRLLAVLSPSVFNREGFWYKYLHSGRFALGLRLIRKFFESNPNAFDYDVSEHAKKLKPELQSFFWSTTSFALLDKQTTVLKAITSNDPNLHIYRSDIASVGENSLQLTDGTNVPANAMVLCTGWKRSQMSLFSEEDRLDLGLPLPFPSEPPETAQHWAELDEEADKKVLEMFPLLRDPPAHSTHPPSQTNYRQYRTMLSPNLIARNDRSIALIGNTIVAHTPTYSHISAIWAIAWLENLMSIDRPKEDLEAEVALTNAYINRRYIAKGRHTPLFIFEAQSFFDTLVMDMGLEPQRHRKGLFGPIRDFVTPYHAHDYSGLEEELLAKCRNEGVLDEKDRVVQMAG